MITWPANKTSGAIDVLWLDGKPVDRPGLMLDYKGVKVRTDHFFNLDPCGGKENETYHLPLPATASQVLTWTRTQVPVNLEICDGKVNYSKSGPFPSPIINPSRITVQVSSIRSDFNTSSWPTDYLWPKLYRARSLKIVTDSPDSKPGIIVLRWEIGNGRSEYHVDIEHDYICTKWIWWEKRSGQWELSRDYTLGDLAQLDQGQWYARKRVLKTYGDPAKNIHGYEVTWNVDITIIEQDQFPPDTFDGKKMLEQAKVEDARIETQ